MRQGLRLIVAVLGLVLGLHVLMLAGHGGHPDGMAAGDGVVQTAAMGTAGALEEPAAAAHDMAVGCLAVLAGAVLLGAGLGGVQRRRMRAYRRWPRPLATPPSRPPPIALGISRT